MRLVPRIAPCRLFLAQQLMASFVGAMGVASQQAVPATVLQGTDDKAPMLLSYILKSTESLKYSNEQTPAVHILKVPDSLLPCSIN